MASFASILVPVEFTQACAVAINRARLIAAEHGAHVTLLHVVTAAVAGVPGGTSRASRDVDQAVARAQASLRRCAAQLAGLDAGAGARPAIRYVDRASPQAGRRRAAAQACDVTVSFGNHDLDRLTLRTSDRVGADLIAVPKDKPSSVADFLLGDTARRMLAEGDCDVLLIPRACFPRRDAMLVTGQRSSIAMQAAAARAHREREPAVSAH